MTDESATASVAAEDLLRTMLDAWAAGIAERRSADVAALFTEDALFQGFDPEPGYGREYITGYYAKQPVGLTADYELLSAREVSGDAIAGYARVLFARPDGAVTVYLSVIAERGEMGWLLSHYHVSKASDG